MTQASLRRRRNSYHYSVLQAAFPFVRIDVLEPIIVQLISGRFSNVLTT